MNMGSVPTCTDFDLKQLMNAFMTKIMDGVKIGGI